MIRATISQTKNKLSSLLERVKAGETILILDRDTPIASIVPANPSQYDPFRQMIKAGLINAARRKPGHLPTPVKAKASALQALLDERSEGR